MIDLQQAQQPHRRYNPLTGEWILVSPHRLKRPWQGQIEETPDDDLPTSDPECYLCPGSVRAGGKVNPVYTETFVFENDFAALLPEGASSPVQDGQAHELFKRDQERGTCKVVCYSPRHDLTLARLGTPVIRGVVDVWARESEELGAREYVNNVLVFENRGEIMGCSNPHPHGQIWATESLPVELEKEDRYQRAYFERTGHTLLSNYAEEEVDRGQRIVCRNESWICAVPYWAAWPFETILIPLERVPSIPELSPSQRDGLADILHRITVRYDNLFKVSFPYTMGFHQAPTNGASNEHWHLHAHFYPPLLRSAKVRKFMVGFEMLGNPQRDLTPEAAAERLRELSETHYRK